MKQEPNIILALDVDSFSQARRFVERLYPKIKIFKVGLELYTACGPKIIEFIHKKGAEIFLDLKLNDIPHTLAKTARQFVKYKVKMFSVHTLAGPTALKEVASVCKGTATQPLGVTILTSICPHFLKDLSIRRPLLKEVLYLAKMAKRCGLAGVVCSAQEAKLIRQSLGRNFIIVTPGIRLPGQRNDDQQRTVTPKEAAQAGSNFLVVGRPILEAKDPSAVLEEMKL